MFEKDIVTKKLFQNNHRFADVFNHLLFHGEVIDPGQLQEMNTDQIAVLFDRLFAKEKYRDILKAACVKHDSQSIYLYLGIENQSDTDFTMPVRTMLYDAINYQDQIQSLAERNRKEKKLIPSRFLSGMTENDRLIPVITLVICWNPDGYKGPKRIYDMMDPEVIREFGRFIPDYRCNLISVVELSDTDIRSMNDDLSVLMEIVKYSKKEEKMRELSQDERIKDISYEVAESIKFLTDIPVDLTKKGKKGNVDMSEGFRLWAEAERKEGKLEGRAEGKAEGIAEGRIKGIDESKEKFIQYLIENGKTKEEAVSEINKLFS